ncbi:LuxR C-terminal-related transcriptional regulator [Kitasatospora sp. MMS16-BH015]|uniref:helix-turn-helix transcriptional regulator n=1 Tax=Kitasatospora sp. MMS16-BH015 TaxID=2018025 RepID=UPI001C2BEA9B|nr:LuxR C-terminal-related transcriptional regulator [Kitasatospora sp. MMS16-BH015]
MAAPPDVALEAAVLDRQQRLDRLRTDARELALRARAATARPNHMIETVAGAEAVLAVIAELELGARHEVLIVDRPPYLDGAADNTHELQALARGVAYRAVYHAPTLVEPGRSPDPARPGPRDLAILRMLASGAKDRAIARALGIGERTVLRRIQTLLETLHADTRFQAGVQAAQRGWLDPRPDQPSRSATWRQFPSTSRE